MSRWTSDARMRVDEVPARDRAMSPSAPAIPSRPGPPALISPTWTAGPRVRLDSLKVGDAFMAMNGERYRIVAWYKDRPGECPIVDPIDGGSRTMFAGCAEGVVL